MPQMTEPITVDEKRTLLKLCLIAGQQTGFILKDVTDLHDDMLLKLYRQWGGDSFAREFKIIGAGFKAEEASANFLAFCKKMAGEVERRMKTARMEIKEMGVTLVIPLGQRGQVQFHVTGEPPSDITKDEMMDGFSYLLTKAVYGYEDYITNPPHLPTKARYQAKSGDTSLEFDFTSIRMVNEAGKRSFFVKGGKFVKYGVRVFPNVLSAAGIDPESITDEKFIAGTAIYTIKATGEPDLVISMRLGVTQL